MTSNPLYIIGGSLLAILLIGIAIFASHSGTTKQPTCELIVNHATTTMVNCVCTATRCNATINLKSFLQTN